VRSWCFVLVLFVVLDLLRKLAGDLSSLLHGFSGRKLFVGLLGALVRARTCSAPSLGASPGSSTRSSRTVICSPAAIGKARSAPRMPSSVPPASSAINTIAGDSRSTRPYTRGTKTRLSNSW
jgi:hypothetical protein